MQCEDICIQSTERLRIPPLRPGLPVMRPLRGHIATFSSTLGMSTHFLEDITISAHRDRRSPQSRGLLHGRL